MLLIENHIMSEHDKKRSNNKKVTLQRWIVIASQEMRSYDEDSRKKENKEDIKEIYWTDSSRNHKHVDNLKKFNHVSLQAWKRRHHTSRSELRSLSKSEKISNMSKRNHELNVYSALNLRCASTWNTYHNKHKQSESNH